MAKRKKKSPVMVGLMTILALSVATLVLVVVALFSGDSMHKERESYVGNGIVGQIATEKVSIKINMENCMMTVGTKMQVTASIYPNGSSAGINWTSSDEEVFTVDKEGNLEVLAPGIVALTANFGDAYDSIAIECITTEKEAVLNLPDYKVFTSGEPTTKEPATKENMTKETTLAGESESSKETTKATEKQTETTSQKQTQKETQTTVQPTSQPPTQKPTKKPQEETTLYTLESTTEYGGTKVTSVEIATRLEKYGFKKYLDNTYVYENGDTYLGEIIITSNMTHIYIKQRDAEFDSAILNVLTELLPDSNGNIWNMYTSAQTDQTVKADGRMVRVVVSEAGGHSQIVVYN